MKRLLCIFIVFALLLVGCTSTSSSQSINERVTSMQSEPTSVPTVEQQTEEYRVSAYVTVPASENWRWIGQDDGENVVSEVDTRYVTHIHFAFGMIKAYQHDPDMPGRPLMDGAVASQEAYRNPADGQYHYRATVNGWIEEMLAEVDGTKYLHALVALKQQKPSLKVLLTIGGWNSDGFCYMTRTKEGRAEFIESCLDLVDEFSLDGIEINWEFPTNGGWGEIANCEHCVEDGRALLTELRAALNAAYPNEHKLMSVASGASQPWVDAETFEVLDYMNIMCYDGEPGTGGSQAGMDLVAYGMSTNLDMVGDTPENRAKFNLGLPFYNEGGPFLVPYYMPWDGYVDCSPEQHAEKMHWVIENGYGGAGYWAYSMDVFEGDVPDANDPNIKILQRTVYETLNGE